MLIIEEKIERTLVEEFCKNNNITSAETEAYLQRFSDYLDTLKNGGTCPCCERKDRPRKGTPTKKSKGGRPKGSKNAEKGSRVPEEEAAIMHIVGSNAPDPLPE